MINDYQAMVLPIYALLTLYHRFLVQCTYVQGRSNFPTCTLIEQGTLQLKLSLLASSLLVVF